MKIFKLLFALCMLTFAISACKQDVLQPTSKGGMAPKPITAPVVQNLPGGAQISYVLPDDANLLYVKAEYTFQGATVNVISSYYKNNLQIQGFADTLSHEVTLYAVSRGDVPSTPVKVQIKPLLAPVQGVRSSLVVNRGYGGFSVQFTNPTKGNVMIGVLRYDNVNKEWAQIDAYYSNLATAKFATRGLDSIPQQFGFFVRDRWNNLTDTLKLTITPIYEEQLYGSKFVDERTASGWTVPQTGVDQAKYLPAPGGISLGKMLVMKDYSSSYKFVNLFDGDVTTLYHTAQNLDQPTWMPFDLGQNYKLSRYKLWQRPGTYLFNHGNPHHWQIWGTLKAKPAATDWILLVDETMIKPSGLPNGMVDNNDTDAGTLGQEYLFPDNVPTVRYLAWKNIDSWGSIEAPTGFFHLQDLIFWGQKKP